MIVKLEKSVLPMCDSWIGHSGLIELPFSLLTIQTIDIWIPEQGNKSTFVGNVLNNISP